MQMPFVGAALGSAFGGIAQAALLPSGLSVAAPAAYALVGVAGMLAANCQVPLTAVLLLFELTHDYFIIVSLFVCQEIHEALLAIMQDTLLGDQWYCLPTLVTSDALQ